MNNFSSKVKKGFLWAAFGAFAGRGVQFISDIILSRLLFPEDFGLIAIGLAVLNISEMLTETGFSSALIQKQGEIKRYLNTAWTMEVLKSTSLFVLVFILSKPIASFYGNLNVINILRAISILFLLRGFRNVGIVFFRKNLEIHKQVLLDVVPSIIQLMIIIPFAYYIKNVWVIVIGVFGRRLTELVLSFLMHSHRPAFEFHNNSFKELFHFGKWIFSISIIGAIGKNFIPLFIGKFFDVEMLGFFNRAELFSILLFAVLIQIIWQVGYPVMSQLQNDLIKLKFLYLVLFYLIFLFGLPLTLFIFIFSKEIILIILSEKWFYSSIILQFLIFAGFLSLLGTLPPMLMQAINRPRISAKITFYSVLIITVFTYPMSISFGMYGLLLSLLFSKLFFIVYGLYYCNIFLHMNLTDYIHFKFPLKKFYKI